MHQEVSAAYRSAEKAERVWRRQICSRTSASVCSVISGKSTDELGEPPAKKPAEEDESTMKELKELFGRTAEMIASHQKTIEFLLEQQKNQAQSVMKQAAQSKSEKRRASFRGNCYFCKKPGHRMSECFKRKAEIWRKSRSRNGRRSQESSKSKPEEHGNPADVIRGTCDTATMKSGLSFCELSLRELTPP